MVVAGAPEKTKYHAHNICDMALDMVRSIDHLKDPSNGNNIQIRVGGWSATHVGLLTYFCCYVTPLSFWLQGSTLGWSWQVWWDIKCRATVSMATRSILHLPWRATERQAKRMSQFNV